MHVHVPCNSSSIKILKIGCLSWTIRTRTQVNASRSIETTRFWSKSSTSSLQHNNCYCASVLWYLWTWFISNCVCTHSVCPRAWMIIYTITRCYKPFCTTIETERLLRRNKVRVIVAWNRDSGLWRLYSTFWIDRMAPGIKIDIPLYILVVCFVHGSEIFVTVATDSTLLVRDIILLLASMIVFCWHGNDDPPTITCMSGDTCRSSRWRTFIRRGMLSFMFMCNNTLLAIKWPTALEIYV